MRIIRAKIEVAGPIDKIDETAQDLFSVPWGTHPGKSCAELDIFEMEMEYHRVVFPRRG